MLPIECSGESGWLRHHPWLITNDPSYIAIEVAVEKMDMLTSQNGHLNKEKS
jgi:hypothetical protein